MNLDRRAEPGAWTESPVVGLLGEGEDRQRGDRGYRCPPATDQCPGQNEGQEDEGSGRLRRTDERACEQDERRKG